jgi:hypothetical protein
MVALEDCDGASGMHSPRSMLNTIRYFFCWSLSIIATRLLFGGSFPLRGFPLDCFHREPG